MSEPAKKIIPIRGRSADALARLERLEDLFLAGLQDIRAVKADLKEQSGSTPTLEKLLDAKAVAEILGENFSERWVYAQAKKNKYRRSVSASIGSSRRRSCKSGWSAKTTVEPFLLSCYQSSMKQIRKGDKPMKSTVFRLDPDVHKALRIAAIEEGISMNEALTQAVDAWLKEYRRKGVKK